MLSIMIALIRLTMESIKARSAVVALILVIIISTHFCMFHLDFYCLFQLYYPITFFSYLNTIPWISLDYLMFSSLNHLLLILLVSLRNATYSVD